MSKITKLHKSPAELIAEMEIQRLYDKALNSSEGLSLEDTKKFDILVKNLRESQEESAKILEENYHKLQKKLMEDLPTDILIDFVDKSLGEADVTEKDAEKSEHSDSEEDPKE